MTKRSTPTPRSADMMPFQSMVPWPTSAQPSLVGTFALWRYVLHVGRGDAAGVFLDPVERVLIAAHDPGNIGFPFDGRGGLHQDVHRQAAIGAGIEFEIVVMPTEPQAGIADLLTDGFQPLGDGLPHGRIRNALLGRHGGNEDSAPCQGSGQC